jgi:DNA-binding NarL/FixJ family response regulator
MKYIKTSVKLDKEVYQKLKQYCVFLNITITDCFDTMIRNYLKKHKIMKEQFHLTNIESEILEKAINDGLQHKEIAEVMSISKSTVDNHMSNIYRKIGVQDMKQLLSRYGFMMFLT